MPEFVSPYASAVTENRLRPYSIRPLPVGSRTGARTVGSGGSSSAFASGLSPAPMVTSPAPPTPNPACGPPAPGFPVRFAPRVMGPFGLRLGVDPPPQVLQIDGRLSHLAPASRVGEGIAGQQGPFAPRALPRLVATAGPSAPLSPSADFPGPPVIRPTLSPPISRRGEEGFSSCSTCPCRRAVAPTPPERPAASA